MKREKRVRTKEERAERTSKIIYFIVLISFILPIIYLILRLCFPDLIKGTGRSDSDYILMLLQCILGAIAINLPSFLSKKLNIRIPRFLALMFLIFLYCAIFLGEVANFYYRIPHWDDILHFFSSMMTGFLGFMVVSILNGHENVKVKMSPWFVALFAFCFSVTIGAVWEIYEFTGDGILGLNMQKFRLEGGADLVGRAALTDTMKDIIVDCIGALTASLLGRLSLVNKKGMVYDYYKGDATANGDKADKIKGGNKE